MAGNNEPNVVFILTDDQGPWAMGCAGNKEIRTPNLDRLAANGQRFENFFCSSPVCSPARASLLTGRIPSQHGVHDWLRAGDTLDAKLEPQREGMLIEYLKGLKGYTDILAENGYQCGLSGKWHLGDSHHPQKSFDFWYAHAKGGGAYYNAPVAASDHVSKEPEYYSDAITNKAINWLNTVKDSQNPFYLSLHFTAPHSPWGRDNHPKDIYDRYYNDCLFESVPDNAKCPKWVVHEYFPKNGESARREALSGYFAAVEAMDSNVGKILDWLAENNLRENTLVIFTSDNGMNMGHHGVFGKGNATYPLNMFEESVKVPFIVSHPGAVKSGVVQDCLVSQYDFMPTLLDYLGLENYEAEKLPGRSFAGILKGESSQSKDCVVVFDEYGPNRMVRTKEWKYVHRYSDGPCELYNLRDDPSEQNNLSGNPECGENEAELRGTLEDWFEKYADPGRDGKNERVTGCGQIGFCGKYADIDKPMMADWLEQT